MDSFIFWDKDIKLKWKYFEQDPKKAEGPLREASTYAGEAYKCITDGEKITSVFLICYFDKSRSYVYKKSDENLRHEQLHFDREETWARTMRKEMSEYMKIHPDAKVSEIDSIYHAIFARDDADQATYDNETEHGVNTAEQDRWKKKIEDELHALDMWGTTDGVVLNPGLK